MTSTTMLYINTRRYHIVYVVKSSRTVRTDTTAPHAKSATRIGQATIKYLVRMQEYDSNFSHTSRKWKKELGNFFHLSSLGRQSYPITIIQQKHEVQLRTLSAKARVKKKLSDFFHFPKPW